MGAAWDCAGAVQLSYDLGGVAIAHIATTPAEHPFARTVWGGTCGAGQLTPGGLRDAARHGKVRTLSPARSAHGGGPGPQQQRARARAPVGPVGTVPRAPRPAERAARASRRGVVAHVDGGPHDAGRRRHARRDGRRDGRGASVGRVHAAVVRASPAMFSFIVVLPVTCAPSSSADRLARAGIRMSRGRCGACRVRGRAGVDCAPARERTAQGAARRRVGHRGARRVGQLVRPLFRRADGARVQRPPFAVLRQRGHAVVRVRGRRGVCICNRGL